MELTPNIFFIKEILNTNSEFRIPYEAIYFLKIVNGIYYLY